MNPTFNTSQILSQRLYTPESLSLTLTDIADRVVTIIDREGITDKLDSLIETLPNRRLTYRGFPYTEQVTTALKDPDSTGLLVTVQLSVDHFEDRHFHEHGSTYRILSRKFNKPIILHLVSEDGKCEVIERYSDIELQRYEQHGSTEVLCVKNETHEKARMS